MELFFKEILLKRLCFDDIETLRQWRNSQFISKNMFFQEEISKEKQLEWFNSLSLENDYYFIVVYKNEPIGLINIKNIDWIQKQGEAGLFIAIEKYRKTPLAIYASLALLKTFFEEKNLLKIFANVRKENQHTIKYNESLGFENVNPEQYVLSKERYTSFTKKRYEKLK